MGEELSKIVVVAGPTASGKSAWGVSLAKGLAARGSEAEIVSLDSVQVYKEFEIGSAKIAEEEKCGIPHHLLSVLEPQEKLDAQRFLELAKEAISSIQAKGKVPIVVGGTTMYLTMLLHGLSSIPQADEELRAELGAMSDEDLYAELIAGDPDTRLHPHDRTRVLRAVEALRTKGMPLSKIHAAHGFRESQYRALILLPCFSRAALYERINMRARLMVEGGLLEETRGLVQRYGEDLHGLRALGYRQALQVLKGEIPDEELGADVAQFTRNFAKRQMTYFRNEPSKRGWAQSPPQPNRTPKVAANPIRTPTNQGPSPGQSEENLEDNLKRTPKVGARASDSQLGDFETLALTPGSLAEAVHGWLLAPQELNKIWYLAGELLLGADCR
jgi:tRNA dimethylallyltransferase